MMVKMSPWQDPKLALTQQPRSHSHQDASSGWCFHCFGRRFRRNHGARRKWEASRRKQIHQVANPVLLWSSKLRRCWSNLQAWGAYQAQYRRLCLLHNAACHSSLVQSFPTLRFSLLWSFHSDRIPGDLAWLHLRSNSIYNNTNPISWWLDIHITYH